MNFVRRGDPNGTALPAWPAMADGRIMMFEARSQAKAPMDKTLLDSYRTFARTGGKLSLF